MSEKVLLHICCGPCAIGAYNALGRQGCKITGFFFNPNIHPLIEFRRRLKAVKVLRDARKLDIICDENYGLKGFLRAVAGHKNKNDRCGTCYSLRLGETCRKAKELGIRRVTSTLLGSPHQDVSLVAEVGRREAAAHGVEFLNIDLRPYHEAGHQEARRMHLYLQQYCGCIYSEYERFKDTRLHLYKGERE